MIIHQININTSLDIKNLILAIGNFDGIHIGHQTIIQKCLDIANQKNLVTGILTFYPHPRQLITGNSQINMIFDYNQKIKELRKLNISHLFFLEFTKELKNMDHDTFIKEILVKKLQIKGVVTGCNFLFGKNRLGNCKVLKKAANKYQFIYDIVAKSTDTSMDISSTRIRYLLSKGMVEQASEILGRKYYITNQVIYGRMLGRTFGFKTANIQLKKDYLYPLHGVYLVKITIKDIQYFGIANIGLRPTIENNNFLKQIKKLRQILYNNFIIKYFTVFQRLTKYKQLTSLEQPLILETHIFKFNDDIYKENIKVEFLNFIRPERKFKNCQDLKYQITKDIKDCLYILKVYSLSF